jgi:hypothetical protein
MLVLQEKWHYSFKKEIKSLAFLIKALCPKHLGLSLYKKEYLPILMVVDK